MRGSRNCRRGGGGGGGLEQLGKVDMPQQRGISGKSQARIQRGEGGSGPPGKSQVIWGSIGNKQLNPLPRKSWTPPPPRLKKVGPLQEP